MSLYDDSINVIKRGKAGAAVEFGNKLWLGENRDGIIVDYKLYQDNPADSNLAKPALKRLVDDRKMDIKNVWGDRGLAVGWAALTHSMWVVARMAEAERRRKEALEEKPGRSSARVA